MSGTLFRVKGPIMISVAAARIAITFKEMDMDTDMVKC